MDNQRLHICYVCKQGEQLQVIDEVFCFLCISLDFKGEDRTAAVREIFLIQCLLLRVLRIQTDDEPSLPADDCSGTLPPSVHSLHDALHEETVSQVPAGRMNAWNGEMVAPVSRRRIARILVTNAAGPTAFGKADAMIARVRLCQGREFTGCLPSQIYRCLRSHRRWWFHVRR